jgi:tetratricopeptide (TPR) repeat protein
LVSPERAIFDAEELISQAIWRGTYDQDFKSELTLCSEAKIILEGLSGLDPILEKHRRRALSQCLLRIDHAYLGLGDYEWSIDRATEALTLAETSGSDVQIARALYSLGNGYLNAGDVVSAERQWVRLLLLAEEYPVDKEMQNVVGHTLIVRGHVLNGKSLYSQAAQVLEDAYSTLANVGDSFGCASACELLADIYVKLDAPEKAETYRSKAEECRTRVQNQPNPYDP